MAKLSLEGNLTIGPACAVDCCSSSVDGASFSTSVCLHLEAAVNAASTRAISSPNAFLEISTVGPTADVSQGSFLYVFTDSAMVLRLTTDDGSGGTTVTTADVHGLYIHQFPSTKPLELLEVKGSGRFAYAVVGTR